MRIFDPHVHMTSRTTDDYEQMAASGVKAIVEPSFWLGQPRTSVGSFVDYFSSLLGWERFRASQFGIRHHCTIGLNPKEANDERLRDEVLEILPRFLEKDGVVAVGEIGFDSMTRAEEETLARQLETGEGARPAGARPHPAPRQGRRHAPHAGDRPRRRLAARAGADRPQQRADRRHGRRDRLLDGVLDLSRARRWTSTGWCGSCRSTGSTGCSSTRRRTGASAIRSRSRRRRPRCARAASPRTTSTGSSGATRSSSSPRAGGSSCRRPRKASRISPPPSRAAPCCEACARRTV